MTPLPRIPRVACIVAYIIAAFGLLSGIAGSLIAIPAAVVPFCAGLGIQRGRIWSAYGYAVLLTAQMLLLPLLLMRGSDWTLPVIIASIVLPASLVILLFLAGKSLAVSGGSPGRRAGWLALTALSVIPLIFVRAYVVPTGSMENSLLVGDRILVRILPKQQVARGDIVVVHSPADASQTYIKRVEGIPGDRIRISHKQLYRNGNPVAEPWVSHKTDYEDSYRDNFPGTPNSPLYPGAVEMLSNNVVNTELVVPPGKYFLLGDNRDYSLDSRYLGLVGADLIIGKPLLIYDSHDQSTVDLSQKPPSPWEGHTRWDRIFKWL